MPNIQQILKKIQRELSCPVCGRKYEMENIKVRGAFEHILIIQTECSEKHLTLFMTVFKDQLNRQIKPVSTDEVLDLYQAITNFNGDFEKLWKK